MRIFNQLRKLTLKSGQLREYLKYALGEIVLVVLGILIALQINTWNEERKIRKEQELTNNILVQSFSLNNLEIEKTILEFEKSLEGTNLRIINSGPNIQNVSPTLIDSIREIDIITLDLAYDFNSNLILDSKTIALLGKDIRSSLLKFKSQYTRYKFIETNVTELITKLRENHQKHIAVFSEIGVGSDIKMQPFNKFESSYIGWLRDRENQNISVEIKWKIEQSLFVLRELDEVNQEVLSALSSK